MINSYKLDQETKINFMIMLNKLLLLIELKTSIIIRLLTSIKLLLLNYNHKITLKNTLIITKLIISNNINKLKITNTNINMILSLKTTSQIKLILILKNP